MAEFHRELATTGRHGAEVTDVAEHSAQWCFCFDTDTARRWFLALNHAAAAVEVANHVANFFFWGEDV